ncbi:MAG: DUF6056 family protein [Anaerolineae bacterium]
MARWWRVLAYACLAFLGAFLASQAYLGLSSRYIADDYCSAAAVNAQGIFGAALHSYLTWSGRYTANLLDSLLGSFSPSLSPYMPAAALAVWYVVLTGTMYALFAFPARRRRLFAALFAAAVLLAAALILTPEIFQSLYWGQGMRSVVPPLILGTALIGILGRYNRQPHSPQSLIWLAAGMIIALLAGGFSETYVVLQTTLLAGALLTVVLRLRTANRNHAWPMLTAMLLGSLLALGLVAAAPGNALRQANFPSPPGLFRLSIITLSGLANFAGKLVYSLVGGQWAFAPLVLAARLISFLGVAATAYLLGCSNQVHRSGAPLSGRALGRILLGLPLAALALLLVCFIPAAYATSLPLPGRTLIIPAYLLVWAAASWGFCLGQYHRARSSGQVNPRRPAAQSIAVSLVVLFALASLVTAYTSLRLQPRLNAYASAWDQVDQHIRQARAAGQSAVVVPLVPNPARLDDLSPDPEFWVNQCVSAYYGLTVTAEGGIN